MYFPQLTFARFIAAMIVVFCHFAQIKEVMRLPLIGSLISNANALISFFFVLTGFVLILSLARSGGLPATFPTRLFWIKRLIRLYPLHWLALLSTMALIEAREAYDPIVYNSSIDPLKLAAHTLLLQAWYPEQPFALIYNYVSWTLSVDLFLAFIAPVLYRWMIKQTTRTLLIRVGLIWLVTMLLLMVCRRTGMPVDWGYLWPPLHIPEFMVGMAGSLLLIREYAALKQQGRWVHWGALSGSILAVVLSCMNLELLFRNSLFFAPIYLLIILSSCLSTHSMIRLCATKPLHYLGKISYAIFILQLPVSIAVLYFFNQVVHWQYRYVGPSFALVLIVVAALTYELMEKPLTGFVNGLLQKRMSVDHQVAALGNESSVPNLTATDQLITPQAVTTN